MLRSDCQNQRARSTGALMKALNIDYREYMFFLRLVLDLIMYISIVLCLVYDLVILL